MDEDKCEPIQSETIYTHTKSISTLRADCKNASKLRISYNVILPADYHFSYNMHRGNFAVNFNYNIDLNTIFNSKIVTSNNLHIADQEVLNLTLLHDSEIEMGIYNNMGSNTQTNYLSQNYTYPSLRMTIHYVDSASYLEHKQLPDKLNMALEKLNSTPLPYCPVFDVFITDWRDLHGKYAFGKT